MNCAQKRLAYKLAAQWLESDCDAYELPADLTEAEESEIREFIRKDIVEQLRRKS